MGIHGLQIDNPIHGEQEDGSVVDKNLNHMSVEERLEIIGSVESLPASQKSIRDDIEHALKNKWLIFILWETGSGKSTCVPVYMREILWGQIIVTQPRVLAAMNVWHRISQVLLAQTGQEKYTMGYGEIWYRTGAGNSSERIAKLSLNTDGTEQARQLQSGIFPKSMMVDEVHSETLAIETLLNTIKSKPEIETAVLSSATMNIEKYQEYLKSRQSDIPVIRIPGRTFPIDKNYNKKHGSTNTAVELAQAGKNVLFFVSGKSEIQDRIKTISGELWLGYEVLPLHAEMSDQEQFKLMIAPEDPAIIRVIVSTNVAEESITIPYINAVVDEGNHKIAIVNSDGIQELHIEPVTTANMLQRAGRAGRVQEWEYFRHNDVPVDELHEYPEASIENNTLEKEILLYSASGRDLRALLSEWERKWETFFLHQVDMNLLNIWYHRLNHIWALDMSGNITPLWKDLLKISLDPFQWRMVLEAIARGDCIQEVLIIASIFSMNGFISKEWNWDEIKQGKDKESDFFTYIDLYEMATSKKLPQHTIEKLMFLWIERESLLEFMKDENTEMLFEVVDLESLGIKNHKIQQIYKKVSLLKRRLAMSWIHIKKKTKITAKTIKKDNLIENIYSSIASGYPFFIFKWDEDENKFIHEDTKGKRSKNKFRQASVSSITPKKWELYIGDPFIISKEDIDQADDFELFVKDNTIDSKFCLLSHITEITEQHLNNALSTQENYKPVFPEYNKSKISPKKLCKNLQEVEQEYFNLLDSEKNYSKKDFLEYILPVLIMSQNHQFKKFLTWKDGWKLEEIRGRLSRFLIQNKDEYLGRINEKNIERTESSFSNDTHIYWAFRDWERKLKNQKRKLNSSHIKWAQINRISVENIEWKLSIFQEKMALTKIISRYTWNSNSINEIEFKKKLIRKMFEELLVLNSQYNTFLASYKSEIATLTSQEKQEKIENIKQVTNTKSQLNFPKTKTTQITRFIQELEHCTIYCDNPTHESFTQIDFEYLWKIFSMWNNKEIFPSKNQYDKYFKSLKSISSHHNNNTGERIWEKKLSQAKTQLCSFINIYKKKLEGYKKNISDISQKIEIEKKWNLKTRQYLINLFEYLYTDEFNITKIDSNINKIMRVLLTDNQKNEEDILIEYVQKWWIHHLKPQKETKPLLEFKLNYDAHSLIKSYIDKIIIDSEDLKNASIEDIQQLRIKLENYITSLQKLAEKIR